MPRLLPSWSVIRLARGASTVETLTIDKLLINFWNTDSSLTPLWISIFLVINLLIHLAPVRVFGEVEFFVSALKVAAVLIFIVVVWAIMGGKQSHGS